MVGCYSGLFILFLLGGLLTVCPNNSYLRSTKRERQLVNEAKSVGLISGRMAGSHSPYDLYIFDPKERTVRLIQVKTKRGARMKITKDLKVIQGSIVTCTVSWE